MMRLREKTAARDGGNKGKSRTYENLVIARLAPGMRILDFGVGQMDYVKRLRGQGVNITCTWHSQWTQEARSAIRTPISPL
jgi:hypothetical protein